MADEFRPKRKRYEAPNPKRAETIPGDPSPYFNYLDLQLRIMNPKASEINYDTAINPSPAFEKGFQMAWITADDFLDELLSAKSTREFNMNKNKLLIGLYELWRKQAAKEKEFLDEYENYVDADIEYSTGRIITNFSNRRNIKKPDIRFFWTYKDYEECDKTKYKDYVKRFSTYIKLGTNEQGNPLIELFRNPQFTQVIIGRLSAIRSTDIVQKYNDKTKKTDLEQGYKEFYEDLFDVFFFADRAKEMTLKNKGKKGELFTLSSGLEKYNKKKATKITQDFNKKFKKFIEKYFDNEQFMEALKGQNGGIDLTSEIIAAVFSNVSNQVGTKNNIKLSLDSSTIKGVTGHTEQTLKKLLLETIRQIVAKNNTERQATYDKINESKSGISVFDDWRITSNNLIGELHVEIHDIKKNGGSDKSIKKLKYKFYEILASGIETIYRDKQASLEKAMDYLDEDYDKIWEILCKTVIKDENLDIEYTDATAYDIANVLSFYGPQQFQGLMGEIATAYAIFTRNRSFSNRPEDRSVSVTGAMNNQSGKINYDVVARIGEMDIGFQVKNYSQRGSYTFYKTSFSMEEKSALRKYVPYSPSDNTSPGALYRWLMANGQLLESGPPMESDGINVREDLTKGLYRYTNNFLRITDANEITDKVITSDIFVINDTYVPASYLIFLVMKQVAYQFEAENNQKLSNPLFSITGAYPNPEKKIMHHRTINGQPNPAASGFTRKDVVFLEKRRKLSNNKINFAGVTINFNFEQP